jgi:hypothetical protein
VYERPFPAWRAQEILLGVLDGALRTAEDVARHLDDPRDAAVAAAR